MSLTSIIDRIGKTPLVRATQLESFLGIREIYFKYEGDNPSGSIADRLANLLIRDALVRGKTTLCTATYGTIGASLAYLARLYSVSCVFYVPSLKKTSRKRFFQDEHVKVIEYGKTYEECVEKSRKIAEENGWYNANPGLENSTLTLGSYSSLVYEIQSQLRTQTAPDSIFIQTSDGYSVAGIHLGYNQIWIRNEIPSIPRIVAASTSCGNAMVESYMLGLRRMKSLDSSKLIRSRVNRHVINSHCFNGQEALNAIYDSNGFAVGVSDQEVIEAHELVRKLERTRIDVRSAYSIAAFIKAAREGLIGQGCHVVVLDDGGIDVDIRVESMQTLPCSVADLATTLDKWLGEYSDPQEEIQEAIHAAIRAGFLICAYSRELLVGICVIVPTGFSHFMTPYHLGYIATKEAIKGQGIGAQILEKAIGCTRGKLSLHVELENRGAIKVYEKMGFLKKYMRMMHRGCFEDE